MLQPLWLVPAFQELIAGVSEVPGPASNPRIDAYLATVGMQSGDETAWCSAFVNWALDQAGIGGTGKPNARSFLDWGDPCEPRVGAITVLWRGAPDGCQGHVAFLLGWSSASVFLLGGNQGDAVSVASYNTQRVLGHRWPKG